MNFPNATASDWDAASRIVAAAARRADFDSATADDMAQNAMLAAVRRADDGRFESPQHFARAVVRFCRLRGWNAIRDRRQPRQPLDAARAVKRGGRMPMDPAWLAERAEGLTRGDRRKAERTHGRRMLDIVHAAAGVGPLADVEPGTVPNVADVGPGYTPPRPIPAQPGDGSAIRTAPRTEPRPLEGEALDLYRERLAEYYATR